VTTEFLPDDLGTYEAKNSNYGKQYEDDIIEENITDDATDEEESQADWNEVFESLVGESVSE